MSNNFYSSIQQRLEQAARAGLAQSGLLKTEETRTSLEIQQERVAGPLENTPEEFERLRKLEGKFVDLARAYKALKSKQDQIEGIIFTNTSQKELKTPEDFSNFERMCKLAEQNFNADREITKLVNQINDLKQSAEADANTNADMYSSMQAKLISREEVFFVDGRRLTNLSINYQSWKELGHQLQTVQIHQLNVLVLILYS
jgi:hypothetical protein